MKIIFSIIFLLKRIANCEDYFPVEPMFRIVGGDPAEMKKWNFLGSLSSNGEHFCGVTLIDPNCGLTAAHCLTDIDKTGERRKGIIIDLSDWYVRFGVYDIASDGGVKMDIENVYVYPGFERKTLKQDIALIKFKNPVPEDLNIIPVELALESPRQDSSCQAAGWGKLFDYENKRSNVNETVKPPSGKLQQVDLSIIANNRCRSIYGHTRITDGMLCTMKDVGGQDACEGDSGGPLMCNGVQVGIISWGEGCGRVMSPGVYTDLAYFHPWLQNKCDVMDKAAKSAKFSDLNRDIQQKKIKTSAVDLMACKFWILTLNYLLK